MFGKLLKQQLKLIYYDTSIIFFIIIASLIGISPLSELINGIEVFQLLPKIFNPFIICFGLIVVSLMSGLNNDKFNLSFLLLTRTRKSITETMIIRIFFTQLIIWIFWCGSSLIILDIYANSILKIYKFQIITLYLYAYIAIILLLLIELNILILTNNKIITFLTAFGINCFEFYLEKTKDKSLIYYFVSPQSELGLFIRFLVLIIFIYLLIIILNKQISKIDF